MNKWDLSQEYKTSSIRKLITIYCIHKSKRKNTVFFTHVERYDKMQHPFKIQYSREKGIKGDFLNMISNHDLG